MKSPIFSLLLAMLSLPHLSQAQEPVTDGIVLSDDVQATFIDHYTIQYDRQRRIQVLRDGAFDGARKDSIIEIKTSHQSSDYLYIDQWQPQCDMPVRRATYTLTVPVGFEMDFIQFGDASFLRHPIDSLKYTSAISSYKAVCYRYECRNLKPLVADDQIFNINDYAFRIAPVVLSVEHVDGHIEENIFELEKLDRELMNGSLVQECFKNPQHPIGAKVQRLKNEGYKVYPVLVRHRSSGQLDRVTHIDQHAFDDILLALISDKDTTFVDPHLPDSIMHIIPPDMMSTGCRMLYLDEQVPASKRKAQPKSISGAWANVFSFSDYHVVENIQMTFDQAADLHIKQQKYYRCQARKVKGRLQDSLFAVVHVPTVGDSLEFAPMSVIDLDIEQIPDSMRRLPAEFPYELNQRYNIIVRLDEHYRVKQYPRNSLFLMSNNGYACQISTYKKNENEIDIIVQFRRVLMRQFPSSHRDVHEFLYQVNNYFAEKIVLERI